MTMIKQVLDKSAIVTIHIQRQAIKHNELNPPIDNDEIQLK